MKIALGQINTTIGDIAGNVSLIRKAIQEADEKKADLIVFPELTLIGYPPQDLLNKQGLIQENLQVLDTLAQDIHHFAGSIGVLVGFADRNPSSEGKSLYNAAAFLAAGKVVSIHHKVLLPNYDVFDEARYFESDPEVHVVEFKGVKLGVSICEDIWNDKDFWPKRLYHVDPIARLVQQNADILINLSCSPFFRGKKGLRVEMLQSIALKYQKPIVYVNLVGGNDELIFDGGSFVLSAKGEIICAAADFKEDLVCCDISLPTPAQNIAWQINDIESIFRALVLGIRDYTRKCGFQRVVLGLSGGIDSALTCAIAVEALGSANVLGVLMPSPFSSQGSVDDALALGQALNIQTITLPIHNIFEAFKATLSPVFEGLSEDVTEENLQARIRGALLMALSNKFGYLLLTTGNKSELGVGYCTLYGDMCGGLAVISDLPKTVVYALAHHINEQKGRMLIPQNSLTKPPSAELRPNQTDQDSLPPYDILDEILSCYIEAECGVREIVKLGYDEKLVREIVTKVDRNEYKRRQAPPGLKVSQKAFGSGRRFPIAQRYRPAGGA